MPQHKIKILPNNYRQVTIQKSKEKGAEYIGIKLHFKYFKFLENLFRFFYQIDRKVIKDCNAILKKLNSVKMEEKREVNSD